jgi:hypothetical protein
MNEFLLLMGLLALNCIVYQVGYVRGAKSVEALDEL